MLDADRLERLGRELLAVAAELRAEKLTDKLPVSLPEPPDEWLSVADAAAMIGCHPERLRKHRREKTGPEYERFGPRKRFVRYRRSVLTHWAARNPGRISGHGDDDDGQGEA